MDQLSLFDLPAPITAQFLDLKPSFPIREAHPDERHHDRLFKGMAKLRHGIARAQLKYSVAMEMHLVSWLRTEGIAPEAMCDWQPELVDLWIDLYLNRAERSA